jgi:predicted TIM-barrel fold metal-dependent hydrolase
MIIIDSHLHVWANSLEAKTAFPFPDPGKEPPPALKEMADTESLRRQMKLANVDGALIVQPINHLFDHRYVTNAIRKYPHIFKGMLLHDPSMNPNDAIRRVEDLALQGFVGVRFNPYLWPSKSSSSSSLQQQQQHFHENMSEGSGLAVYQRCAELNMPVGIMCFHGIHWHYEDILQLIQKSPQTKLILDHFGFTRLDKPETFTQLLSLSKYPNVHVKISALFRLHDTYPYDTIKTRRFRPLLDAFGSERLLYGSDFPYVLEQPTGYEQVPKLIAEWCTNDQDRAAILGGTAESLFGAWGVPGSIPF